MINIFSLPLITIQQKHRSNTSQLMITLHTQVSDPLLMAILVINQHIITYTEHASQVLSATDLNNYKFSVYINIHVNSRLVYPLICGSLSTYCFTTIYKYYIYITKSDMKLNKRWPLLLRYRSYKCSEVQIINLEVASIINKIN